MLLHTFTKDFDMGRTLYDKLWDAHLVDERDDGSALIYIDRHLIHEVTSPQAFEVLIMILVTLPIVSRGGRQRP